MEKLDDRIEREEKLSFQLTAAEVSTAVHEWILANSEKVHPADLARIDFEFEDFTQDFTGASVSVTKNRPGPG